MLDTEKFIRSMSKAFSDHGCALLTTDPLFLDWCNGKFFKKSKEISSVLNDQIRSKSTEIFWSIASLQISFGDLLILKENENRNKKNADILNGLLMQHRIYTIYEQLYRIWERYTGLLAYLFLQLISKQKFYFNNLISELKPLKQIKDYKKLAFYCNKWNSIAHERNNISHQFTSLTANIDISPEISPVVDCFGENFKHTSLTISKKAEYIEKITSHIGDINCLNETVRNFILTNNDYIFKFRTAFPWKIYSVSKPKEQKKYLIYKLGQYEILDKTRIDHAESIIQPSQEYIYWKDIEPPPNQSKAE